MAFPMDPDSINVVVMTALSSCVDMMLKAVTATDSAAISYFAVFWQHLCNQIDEAQRKNYLTFATIRRAHDVTATVRVLARQFSVFGSTSNSLQQQLRRNVQNVLDTEHESTLPPVPSPRSTALPFAWVEPLLIYIWNNICSPYPGVKEKRRLIHLAYSAGWTEVTQKKLDDWLNMMRTKMGYTLLLKSSFIGDDRGVMADVVRRILFGGQAERIGLNADFIRDVEEMRSWVRRQFDNKAAKEHTGSWAHDILEVVQELSVSSNQPSAEVDEDGDSEYSDNDSLYSQTDVDDFDGDLHSLSGAKRKFFCSPIELSHSASSRRSSSSSRSKIGTASIRSCSASSWGSGSETVYDSEDDTFCGRPAKRRCTPGDVSEPRLSSQQLSLTIKPSTVVPRPSHVEKRKYFDEFDDDRTCDIPNKRPRLTDIQQRIVSAAHIETLSTVASLSWDAAPLVAQCASGLDFDSFVLDGSPLDFIEGDNSEQSPSSVYRVLAVSCESDDHQVSPDACDMWLGVQLSSLAALVQNTEREQPDDQSSTCSASTLLDQTRITCSPNIDQKIQPLLGSLALQTVPGPSIPGYSCTSSNSTEKSTASTLLTTCSRFGRRALKTVSVDAEKWVMKLFHNDAAVFIVL